MDGAGRDVRPPEQTGHFTRLQQGFRGLLARGRSCLGFESALMEGFEEAFLETAEVFPVQLVDTSSRGSPAPTGEFPAQRIRSGFPVQWSSHADTVTVFSTGRQYRVSPVGMLSRQLVRKHAVHATAPGFIGQ